MNDKARNFRTLLSIEVSRKFSKQLDDFIERFGSLILPQLGFLLFQLAKLFLQLCFGGGDRIE